MKSVFTSRTYVMVFITVWLSTIGYSQKNVDHQSLLWTRYQLKLKFNPHWSASQQFEERTYWFPWRQHQFLSRTTAHYQLSKDWTIGTGVAYFRQALPQDAHKDINYTQPEVRPHLEIAYTHELVQDFNLNHRFGTELRYFKQENEDLRFGNYRLRYKLELQYQLKKQITLKAYDEVFVNFGKTIDNNTFDQNRVGAGIQYMPQKNFGFELGYINWYQKRASGIDFYERNIVRLTIHHTLDLYTSKKIITN
ncbi:MAG: DUF2490 domain-containing protein [Aquaticitalea sp.]